MDKLVFIKSNNALCSSLTVAEHFNKAHKDVLKKIDNLLKENSAQNCALFSMFKLSKYKSENGFQKCYLMNRDGFSLLVMRFTGKKALEWQMKYINAFNKMEKHLSEIQTPEWEQMRLTAKSSTDTLHDVIHDKFLPYAIANGSDNYEKTPKIAYKHFEDPINKAFGIQKKQRDFLSIEEQNILDIINKAVAIVISKEIENNTEYHDIIKIAKDKINTLADMFIKK